MTGMSGAELQNLCNVNHETEVAFLGVTGPRENEEVVGSACYFLSPTTNLAETAFMVAPEWQGLGLGSALQARLQEYAASRGVRGFVAEILPQNQRMQRLATGAPGRVTTVRDQDAVRRLGEDAGVAAERETRGGERFVPAPHHGVRARAGWRLGGRRLRLGDRCQRDGRDESDDGKGSSPHVGRSEPRTRGGVKTAL